MAVVTALPVTLMVPTYHNVVHTISATYGGTPQYVRLTNLQGSSNSPGRS